MRYLITLERILIEQVTVAVSADTEELAETAALSLDPRTLDWHTDYIDPPDVFGIAIDTSPRNVSLPFNE